MKARGIMVAAGVGVDARRAAELAGPDDERAVEAIAVAQVLHQVGKAGVGLAAQSAGRSRSCFDACPSRPGRLRRTSPPPRRAGAPASSPGRTRLAAIAIARGGRFARQIERLQTRAADHVGGTVHEGAMIGARAPGRPIRRSRVRGLASGRAGDRSGPVACPPGRWCWRASGWDCRR